MNATRAATSVYCHCRLICWLFSWLIDYKACDLKRPLKRQKHPICVGRWGDWRTSLALSRSLAVSGSNTTTSVSRRLRGPDALLNVLMWLNVPSKTTTLGREISFVWFFLMGGWVVWVSALVCPLKTDKDCLMVLLAHTKTAQLVQQLNLSWTIRRQPAWLSAAQISSNRNNNVAFNAKYNEGISLCH